MITLHEAITGHASQPDAMGVCEICRLRVAARRMGDAAYLRGLRAAREAVAGAIWDGTYPDPYHKALSAINRLIEEAEK